VALDADCLDRSKSLAKVSELNSSIRNFLQSEMNDVDIASPLGALPHLLSFSFLYIDAEQLVDRMERRGFSIDSGSACISANLEASHVLAAMGRLTHGNVRIHLYPEHSQSDITSLLLALKEEVTLLRGNA
jgi:cysteine desulfurase